MIFQKIRWIFHPIFIFIFLTTAIIATFLLYIYWYIEITEGLNYFVETFNLDPGQILKTQTGFVFLVISMLATLILFSMFTAFIYYKKTLNLYRQQHNFIYNFTHELKTPVTSINLYLETLLKYKISEEDKKKYIKYMLSDINKLSNDISRILNLAKLESDFYESNFIKVNLARKIKDFYNKNKHLFNKIKIDIKNELKKEEYVKLNLALFNMVLMNIIINAIKYNVREDKKIYIRIYEEKNKIAIEFEDNGIGINKKDLKKIFKKFYQIKKKEDEKGSGLGLYLIKNIAKIHKWKIKVNSIENEGSKFILLMNKE